MKSMIKHNKPLKFVPATKSVASTGLANARRLAGRYISTTSKTALCRKPTSPTVMSTLITTFPSH
ncbi:hypothetical protein E0L35_24130 [Halomonas sp. ATBC28]|nr:hypothetical protein E0L35_24130 [Halomonas sp. ATBC28]